MQKSRGRQVSNLRYAQNLRTKVDEAAGMTPEDLWDYWNFRCELALTDGLITKGDRLIIPQLLREDVFDEDTRRSPGRDQMYIVGQGHSICQASQTTSQWFNGALHVHNINMHI